MMARKARARAASDVDKLVGQRVRLLRMQLGMSQEDLGKGVDLTFQQIQKYEKGVNRISVSRMLQFADILQTTPNDIIGWKAKTTVAANSFSPPVFEAAREFSDLPEDVQILMRKLCSAVTDVKKKR